MSVSSLEQGVAHRLPDGTSVASVRVDVLHEHIADWCNDHANGGGKGKPRVWFFYGGMFIPVYLIQKVVTETPRPYRVVCASAAGRFYVKGSYPLWIEQIPSQVIEAVALVGDLLTPPIYEVSMPVQPVKVRGSRGYCLTPKARDLLAQERGAVLVALIGECV